MEKQRYLPSTDEDRLTWHSNYQAKLATYAVKYNIPDEEVKQAKNDNQHLAEIIVYRRQFNDFAKAITQYKNGIMNDTAALQPLVIPTPVLTNPAALPGIFVRTASVVARIKGHTAYTEADGRDLGIIGAETSLPDAASHKPVLNIRSVAGGYPEVLWTKGVMDAIELQQMDANGNWQFLAIDTEPNYTDSRPLPANGTAELRKYRAIYRLHDERYGVWSDIISYSVSG